MMLSGTSLHQGFYFLWNYVTRWQVKCFLKLFLKMDLVAYHYSSVVKELPVGLWIADHNFAFSWSFCLYFLNHFLKTNFLSKIAYFFNYLSSIVLIHHAFIIGVVGLMKELFQSKPLYKTFVVFYSWLWNFSVLEKVK